MKKMLACFLCALMLLGVLSGCGGSGKEEAVTAPKYIFLFIGDGMSYPQIQATADYLGALQDEDYFQAQPSIMNNNGATLDGPEYLNFMNFEVAGSAVNYDANSFAPDSSASATAIATGNKTYSAMINTDVTGKETFETIAQKAHEQLGYKIGLITTANPNHATPAAFYAHQINRNNFYEIGLELPESGFEYFAGGGFYMDKGTGNNKESLYDVASAAGYTVARTAEEAAAVSAESGKVILVNETLADSESMPYEIDREEGAWTLADYVKKGIEVLDNEKGFFMMCEGGKIDWACHANDAATVIHETIALSEAVQVAIDFAAEHPEETLIIVTGDHETGGMSIGFAGTEYDTYLTLLENQKISFKQFDEQYIESYRENGTSFEDALADFEALFGLKIQGEKGDKLVLTEYELGELRVAYEKSVNGVDTGMSEQEEDVAYGSYEPLSVELTRTLNHKAGIGFTSFVHTGLPVAVFADGLNSEMFVGYYDNTEIFYNLAEMLHVA